MSDALLQHHTPLERMLDALTGARIADIPVPVRALHSAQDCPASVLPWLAWEMQVGNFNSNWQTPVQRQSIASSARIHRQKGTLASAQIALNSAGYSYARIEVSHGNYRRDGSMRRDGFCLRGVRNPYRYRVKVSAVISIAQANEIRALLAETLPVRCQLHSFEIVNACLLRNGAIRRDGSYTRGIA